MRREKARVYVQEVQQRETIKRTEGNLTISLMPMNTMDGTGYATINRHMPENLKRAGAQFSDWRSFAWDVRLALTTARAAMIGPPPQTATDFVFHTMFEADPLPPGWAAVLNKTLGVWVPSQWCKDVFEASGVTVPIVASGYGIDPSLYHPLVWADGLDKDGNIVEVDPEDAPKSEIYRFIWIGDKFGDGRTHGGRKNGMLVVKAFLKLGLPNAELIIKLPAIPGDIPPVDIDGVTVIAETLPVGQYLGLIQSAGCVVYPSAGEGFGLIPLECMAVGRPVIAPQWSGLADYVSEENAIVLPVARRIDAWIYQKIYGHRCYWAEYDIDDLCDRMRWAYYHRDEAEAIGRRAAETAKGWSWREAGRKGLAALNELVGGKYGSLDKHPC